MFEKLTILVTPDEENGTTQTDLRCNVNGCGKRPEVLSNGPKTEQKVVCPEHGLLASFPNQAAFEETVRVMANDLLAMHGHAPIEAGTPVVRGELKSTKSAN